MTFEEFQTKENERQIKLTENLSNIDEKISKLNLEKDTLRNEALEAKNLDFETYTKANQKATDEAVALEAEKSLTEATELTEEK
jgi:hypothetical protein